ncbi:MAG TPA: hypothetical protein VGI40_20810 [Pirellulaceae bacterium]
MPTTKPRYSKEEFARRGDAIYDREIAPRLEDPNRGEFVSIDIESGAFEIDGDEIAATKRLRARISDAQVWFRRVGSKFARRFGPRPQRAEQ